MPAKFVPFNTFVKSVTSADTTEFLANTESKVKDTSSFEEMRRHIINTYQGVQVSHSYVLGAQTYDCVPINQQPSVRAFGITKIATPPPTAALKAEPGTGDHSIPSQLSQLPAGKTEDDFGNRLGCEAGTIPMSRITLEQLSRFENLQSFFAKGPNGQGHAPIAGAEASPSVTPSSAHKYSFTYQYVNNLGPSTNINIWRPYVYSDEGEIFSLAQLWTIGTGTTTQTAEVGWQNYPGFYGNENPNLFIYWTADGYNKTGCYNLSCAGFVQYSSSLHLGASFSNFSISDGPQYEIQLQYYLYNGNWWLSVGNTWMGYYPASIYGTGQLSKYSNLLEFGSESVPGYYEGVNVWPAEGSGLFAANGWTYSAYQRLIYYVNTSGTSVWAALTADQPSPACYTISGPVYSSSWGEYFYFGGPGGSSCQ